MTHFDNLSIKRRRTYFVDRELQGAVLKQALLYWGWTTVVFGLVLSYCRIVPAWLAESDAPWGSIWFHLGPYVIASIVLFPIMVVHSIKFSNRFAGPMVRVRRSLKALARGEKAEFLKFRERDYWTDIAEDINAISARMSEATGEAVSSTTDKQDAAAIAPVDTVAGTETGVPVQS